VSFRQAANRWPMRDRWASASALTVDLFGHPRLN
jgi:hypothetical protein